MDKKRLVHQMSSIFELSDCENLDVKKNAIGRVMFRYDGKQNKKEFKLLNKNIPANLRDRIISWLDQNIDVDNSLFN